MLNPFSPREVLGVSLTTLPSSNSTSAWPSSPVVSLTPSASGMLIWAGRSRCVVQVIDGHVALQIAQPGRTVRGSIVCARAGNTC